MLDPCELKPGNLVKFKYDFDDRECSIKKDSFGVVIKKEVPRAARATIWWIRIPQGAMVPVHVDMVTVVA